MTAFKRRNYTFPRRESFLRQRRRIVIGIAQPRDLRCNHLGDQLEGRNLSRSDRPDKQK